MREDALSEPERRKLRELLTQILQGMSRWVDESILEISGIDPSALVGRAAISRYVEEHLGLISRITDEHRTKMLDLYTRDGLAGLTSEAGAARIKKTLGVSANKAKFWARDQGLKFHANLTKERATAVGLRRYRWITSNDERVRDEHDALNGQLFTFDNPPSVGNPGEDYNCRCLAELVAD